MLSTGVSPKPLSTRVIYQGQSEALPKPRYLRVATIEWYMCGVCLSDHEERVTNEGSVRS